MLLANADRLAIPVINGGLAQTAMDVLRLRLRMGAARIWRLG